MLSIEINASSAKLVSISSSYPATSDSLESHSGQMRSPAHDLNSYSQTVQKPLPSSTYSSSPADNTPKTKVGKDLLAALRQKNKSANAEISAAIPLTETLVTEIKEGYLQQLVASGRDLLRNQFMTTVCTARDESTFECKCSMHLQYNSINNLKQELADFITQKVNNPKVKVITILEEQEVPDAEKVLSKVELFEQYARQFPLLRALSEELHLSVKGSYEYIPPPPEEKAVIDTAPAGLEDEQIDNLPIEEE